jgi:hypothetical protein
LGLFKIEFKGEQNDEDTCRRRHGREEEEQTGGSYIYVSNLDLLSTSSFLLGGLGGSGRISAYPVLPPLP